MLAVLKRSLSEVARTPKWVRAGRRAAAGASSPRVALQEVAQALGHREDPLPHRQVRQDVIGEMGCGRHHAPAVARWAHAAPFARAIASLR